MELSGTAYREAHLGHARHTVTALDRQQEQTGLWAMLEQAIIGPVALSLVSCHSREDGKVATTASL